MLRESQRYAGDLTITLDGGINFRIPNHQLVVPNVEINPQGQEYIPNANEANVLFDAQPPPSDNDNKMPVLGRPFFSSAYLVVDNARGIVAIYANPNQRSQPELIQTVSDVCARMALPTTPAHSSSSSKQRVGTVVGVTVGAVVAICLIVFFGPWCLRRRRRRIRNALAGTMETSCAEGMTNRTRFWKPRTVAIEHPLQAMSTDHESDSRPGSHERLFSSRSESSGLPPPYKP